MLQQPKQEWSSQLSEETLQFISDTQSSIIKHVEQVASRVRSDIEQAILEQIRESYPSIKQQDLTPYKLKSLGFEIRVKEISAYETQWYILRRGIPFGQILIVSITGI